MYTQIFGFYEEFLSARFPYSNYKMVFVDEAYRDAASYSTLGIFRFVYLYQNTTNEFNVCAYIKCISIRIRTCIQWYDIPYKRSMGIVKGIVVAIL